MHNRTVKSLLALISGEIKISNVST